MPYSAGTLFHAALDGQLFGEGVSRDNLAFAVLGWIQRDAIDGILRVRCHISDTSVLVDAEIVRHAPRRNMVRVTNCVERLRIDRYAHEQLPGVAVS